MQNVRWILTFNFYTHLCVLKTSNAVKQMDLLTVTEKASYMCGV